MGGGFRVFKFPSFQGGRDGGREGGPKRGLGTDHVISGPMRGLKKLQLMAHTDRQTDIQTLGLYD